MRNWSSYLKEIKDNFNTNPELISKGATFNISKILHSERNKQSKAVNKGIYLGVVDSKNKETIAKSVDLIKKLTSKQYMETLIKETEFYDLPPYHSLIQNGIYIQHKL